MVQTEEGPMQGPRYLIGHCFVNLRRSLKSALPNKQCHVLKSYADELSIQGLRPNGFLDSNWRGEMRKGKRAKLQRRSDKIIALAKKIGKAWRWSVEVKNKKKQLKCQYQAYSNAVNAQGEQERLSQWWLLIHTWYLSFFLHWQNFWRIKFTPKNANFSR